MASNITKILFRRGTDSQRRTGGGTGVTPQAGEPIFCTDSKRLFIGDDTTVGGIPAGVTNYGQVSALFGSYNGSALDYAAWTIFNSKSVAAGDLIYDQSTSLLYTLTGTPAPIPALSSFVSYPSKLNVNTNQFTFSGSKNQLNIKDGGINAAQINSAALDNLTLDNSGTGNTLEVKTSTSTSTGITNAKLAYAPANSVKGNITGSTGSVTDLALTTGNIQFVGTTDSSNLTAVLLTSGAGIGVSVAGNSVSFNNTTTIAADDGIIFDQGTPVVNGGDITVNANNSLQYFKYSDFRAGANTVSTVTYTVPDDGSLISMYKMDYTSPSTAKSFISFESTALGTYSPTITINWLASGANPNTIFYTNSSQKSTTYSAWSPNNYVNTMLKDGNTLYIGGQFTKMANLTARNRFAIVNLAGGSTYTSGSTYLGPMGSLSSTGVAAIDTTGLNGTVYKILKFNYSTTSYLCIAGNFTNATSTAIPGPATDADYLAIYNITAGYTLVGGYRLNSTVYDLLSSGNYLYVAGNMTTGIINAYGSPVQTTPITMDGLMRIDMSGVALSADTTFIRNVSSAITMGVYDNDGNPDTPSIREPIYTMAALSGILYVGGWHYAKTGSAITQKHLTAHYMNTTYNGGSVSPGGLVTTFQPIYNGNAVNKLAIDTSDLTPTLYVGGDFTTYASYGQTAQAIYRLMAFDLGTVGGAVSPITPNSYSWYPQPNGLIYQIEPLLGSQNDPLYVGGTFSKIAGKSQKYLAAIQKATTSPAGGIPAVYNWNPIPNTSFTTTGRGTNILTIPSTDPLSGVLISGTFTQIGGAYRRYIARVAGYNQVTPPALSSVGFDVAAATISDGGSLGVDTTSLVYVTGFAGIQDTVNVSTLVTQYNTTFSNFPQFNRGDLVRYYVRRTGAIDSSDPLYTLYGSGITANDTYGKSIYLMSIGIDYNTKLPAPSATS